MVPRQNLPFSGTSPDLATAFQVGAIPFQETLNMDRVECTIAAAKAVQGANVAVLSLSGTRLVEPIRSRSGILVYPQNPLEWRVSRSAAQP